MRPDTDWILTFTGRQCWPLDPQPEDICIEDIAHALSNICRFTGHVREFYSVAQHSVLCSLIVHPRYALAALLHDASEAYLCDIARPVKQALLGYAAAEEHLQRVIFEVFDVDCEMGGVKVADEQLLITERRDLMADGHWIVDERNCLTGRVVPMPPQMAEVQFLHRFEVLRAR